MSDEAAVVLAKGATVEEIVEAEHALKVTFPDELKDFLKDSNGIKTKSGESLIWSTSEIVSNNQFYRSDPQIIQEYMPLGHMLFFAEASQIDCLFGYPIVLNERQKRSWIFYWNRQEDTRDYAKYNLVELVAELIAPVQSFHSRLIADAWDTNVPTLESLKAKIAKSWNTFPPATDNQIKTIELQLNKRLPEALREFYLYSNGLNSQIGFEIFALQELESKNVELKSRYHQLDDVMPVDSFLFFAKVGNGDILGYPIRGAGVGDSVMTLYQETDGRNYAAQDLYFLLEFYLDDGVVDEDHPLHGFTEAQLEALGLEYIEDDYLAAFYKAFPLLKNTGLEIYNALPQTLLEQHPGLFKAKEIHSVNYLSGIPEKAKHKERYVHHLLLDSWKGFLKTNQEPTREHVIKHMRALDKTYGKYFVPVLVKGAR